MAFFSLALIGCGGSKHAEAEDCGVSADELRRTIEEVKEMAPYSGRTLGNCEILNDDAGNVQVITPEIQQSVDSMIAREKAESEN